MANRSDPGALVGATGSGKHHKRLASDPPGNKPSIREYQARILARRLRRQRVVSHLHRLGPSPLFRFLAEIEAGANIQDTLETYGRLPVEFVRALGGDRFAPSLHCMDGGER
jgi:hypothetical protein